MIYLELSKEQGLGNQLWNYATLRSFCDHKGYEYKIIGKENFKGQKILDVSFESSEINKFENIKPYLFNEKIYFDYQLKTFASDFDESILKVKPNTIIKGLFQSENYFFKRDINKYFKVKENIISKNKIHKKKCILNIRGGEYKRFKELILPKTYWINAMKEMKKYDDNISFTIVTDDYKYATNLLPGIEIIKGDINNDFLNIYWAEYLIVSNSSFSYFPIKLGDQAKKVIAPANWARFGNIYNRWISPANYYKGWEYMNNKGEILLKEDIHKILLKTKSDYQNYNVITNELIFKKKSILFFIPKNIRKKIKNFLSNIFPLHIG